MPGCGFSDLSVDCIGQQRLMCVDDLPAKGFTQQERDCGCAVQAHKQDVSLGREAARQRK